MAGSKNMVNWLTQRLHGMVDPWTATTHIYRKDHCQESSPLWLQTYLTRTIFRNLMLSSPRKFFNVSRVSNIKWYYVPNFRSKIAYLQTIINSVNWSCCNICLWSKIVESILCGSNNSLMCQDIFLVLWGSITNKCTFL